MSIMSICLSLFSDSVFISLALWVCVSVFLFSLRFKSGRKSLHTFYAFLRCIEKPKRRRCIKCLHTCTRAYAFYKQHTFSLTESKEKKNFLFLSAADDGKQQ